MLNLSLSGCGFLGIYHIGVISAFREHAPEILQSKISGCSAGSLVAACAVCNCCLGQMVSDVLEAALKARSYALGPLHPSFSIVDILRNGLRRILPVDAHKICSGRVHISLTRWKDGKNFLVNQFDSREELIQALICSTFVPCYSGFLPPKFKGTYYWDGGLSNNNPILDQDTILVSPFGGEADICPREESSSYLCYDFQGTNLQFSHENIYRISKALFPPNPEILKAMCFRGYKDAVNFLKARNLLQCSCNRMREKTSISSVIGEDLTAFSVLEGDFNGILEEEQSDSMYDSEEDNISQYDQSNQPLHYKEMPTLVCDILDAACDDNKGMFNYVYDSELSRVISIMFLPWTLPFEFSIKFTKKMLELIPTFKVSANQSKNLIDTIFLYINFIIHKFTYDKYQYHSRQTCQHCLPRTRSRSGSQSLASAHYSVCYHNNGSKTNLSKLSVNVTTTGGVAAGQSSSTNSMHQLLESHQYSSSKLSEMHMHKSCSRNQFYFPKICPRHRVPSVCSSDAGNINEFSYPGSRKSRRSRSHLSGSEVASSVDLNEFKISKSYFLKKKKPSSNKSQISSSVPNKAFQKMPVMAAANGYKKVTPPKKLSSEFVKLQQQTEEATKTAHFTTSNAIKINVSNNSLVSRSKKEGVPRVHFHLANTTDEDDDDEEGSIEKLSASNEAYSADKLFKQALGESSSREESVSGGMSHINTYPNLIQQRSEVSNTDVDMVEEDADQVNPSSANPILEIKPNFSSSNLLFKLEDDKTQVAVDEKGATAAGNSSSGEQMILNCEGKKSSIEWENYWDNLEFNALGKLNI